MAFIVHCGRCRLSPSRCEILLTQWREAAARGDVNVNEQALHRLSSFAPDQLATLGLEDDTYTRGWLASGYGGTTMALSLLLLEWTTLLPALPPQVWHAMVNDPGTLALPAHLTRRVVAGATLAQWLSALTHQRMHSPPDAHLGNWVPGRTALRLLPYLRPTGADTPHDAIHRILKELTNDDWLLINPIW